MNKDIIQFIRKQKTATVCTVDEQGNPYCFSCFYVFDEEKAILIYKTHADSHHVPMMQVKKEVAGSILPGKADPVIVRGIQFEGIVIPSSDPSAVHASRDYHLRYPFALAMGGDIWVIRLQHIKMTDSSKGFGTKIEWTRD
ncbi:MAG: pyridoxamine 5'-phosphate oxidase family protein [Chitinophagaceae bacterium]|nr:pyridoxamine 5'-phosphate oxidase family protein [Chitinophagaceae bacterium]